MKIELPWFSTPQNNSRNDSRDPPFFRPSLCVTTSISWNIIFSINLPLVVVINHSNRFVIGFIAWRLGAHQTWTVFIEQRSWFKFSCWFNTSAIIFVPVQYCTDPYLPVGINAVISRFSGRFGWIWHTIYIPNLQYMFSISLRDIYIIALTLTGTVSWVYPTNYHATDW